VYWPRLDDGTPDRYGRKGYGHPVELNCRWDDMQQLIKLPNGEETMSKATVYVDIELELGGILWHGELVDCPATPPSSNAIIQKASNPNMRNKEVLRTVYL